MRCAAAPGVLAEMAEMAAIRDESFASTASKIGSTHPACTTGYRVIASRTAGTTSSGAGGCQHGP
jgi:hypothetical protein